MPAKTFDKALEKIDRAHEKTVELLQREINRERDQAIAASAGVEEARSKLQDLEYRRPALASEVFAGAAEYSDLDALDSELDRLRRHAEVAEIAQEQAGEKAPAIEQRMATSAREAAAKRYNVLAGARKERAVELDSTLDALTAQVDALLDLDRRQRDEEQNLGIAGGGVAYDEQLENHIMIRIQRHVRPAALSVNGIDMNIQRAALVDKDYRTKTLDEARSENETESAGLEVAREQRDAYDQARDRRERYDRRRQEIHAKYGYTKDFTMGAARRTQVDVITDDALRREFPDLFEEERQAAIERRRGEIRGLLGYAGEDLSDEERQQLDDRVIDQLAEEFPQVEKLINAV